MKPTDFLDAGYKSFSTTNLLTHSQADGAYQKFIRHGGETIYVINIYHYRFDAPHILEGTKPAWQACVQLYRGEDTFDISFCGKSVEHIESTVLEIWEKLSMDNDHHN